jgi:hypothetical protein
MLPLPKFKLNKVFKKFADIPFTGDNVDEKWKALNESGILNKLKNKLIA